MTKRLHVNTQGFTFLELMIVMAIIAILLSGAFFAYIRIIERSRINQAVSDIQEIRRAVEEFHADTGVYPRDSSNRAMDSGFVVADPTTNETTWSPTIPIGWSQALVSASWRGPYLDSWPIGLTPWGGDYDYNYWPNAGNRYGCTVPAGLYVGIEALGSGNVQNAISVEAENYFIEKGYDVVNPTDPDCAVPNGEVQFLIKPLPL